jgi:hypothetical protein
VDLGDRQEGEALHAGEHIRVRGAQCQVVQLVDDAQALQLRGVRQLLWDAPKRAALRR